MLLARLAGERKQMQRILAGLARRLFVLPWLARPPVGIVELSKLASPKEAQTALQLKTAAQAQPALPLSAHNFP